MDEPPPYAYGPPPGYGSSPGYGLAKGLHIWFLIGSFDEPDDVPRATAILRAKRKQADACDPTGTLALHWAVKHDRRDIAKLILGLIDARPG